MHGAEPVPMRCWSTAEVQPANRLDYFAAALSEAIVPLAVVNADMHSFHAELSVAYLGEIKICVQTASPHTSCRGVSEIARSGDHQFSLTLTRDIPWDVDHRGRARMLPGDILFHDSGYPFWGDIRQRFNAVNVSVTERWLRRWIPNPSVLVGRIAGQSAWGSALSSYIAALTPDLIASRVLPASVLADQLGGLLALAASARGAQAPDFTPALVSLHARIGECIAQRCTEPQLSAGDVARSVNVSIRTLHRALAAANETFGAKLIAARVRVAERMLNSPLFNRMTTAEIGHRAGFVSASHFAKVVLRHTGRSPLQIRKSVAADSRR